MASPLRRPNRLARIPLIVLALVAGSAASAKPLPCSNATLKGTYLYNESGVLNGKPYAESGREVYDGQGGIVLSFQGSDGSGGVEQATYSVSADCIGTATYPDGQPTALSGSEVRVAP